MTKTSIARISTILVAAFLPYTALADSVVLKAGETIEGRILDDNPQSVTIRYNVTDNITDVRVIPRSEIQEVIKLGPDDILFGQVEALVPTKDLTSASRYQRMIEGAPAQFIKLYPGSKHVTRVREVLKTLEGEYDRVKKGMRKIDNQWVTRGAYESNKYNYEALLARKNMELSVDNGKYVQALLTFSEIQNAYSVSTEYPKAIAIANSALDKYETELKKLESSHPAKVKQRTEGFKNLTPDEKKQADAKVKADAIAFKKKADLEKKNKVKWPSVDDYHKESITAALASLTKERTTIKALPIEEIQKTASLAEAGFKMVGAKDYENAYGVLEQALARAPKETFLRELRDKAKAEVDKARSASKTKQTAVAQAKAAEEKEVLEKEEADKKKRREAARANLETAQANTAAEEPESGGLPVIPIAIGAVVLLLLLGLVKMMSGRR